MSNAPAGAAPPSPRTLLSEPTPGPTAEEICAARWWALDHDREALLAHRVARLAQADRAERAAADLRLVARHRAAVRAPVR